MACPRRSSSDSRADLPPPEQPEIITNMTFVPASQLPRRPLLGIDGGGVKVRIWGETCRPRRCTLRLGMLETRCHIIGMRGILSHAGPLRFAKSHFRVCAKPRDTLHFLHFTSARRR